MMNTTGNNGAPACPLCGKNTLGWNSMKGVYTCANPYCQNTFTAGQIAPPSGVRSNTLPPTPAPINTAPPAWGQETYEPVRQPRRRNRVLESIIALFVVSALGGIVVLSGLWQGETPAYLKASGERMELVDNPGALNPSWDELKTFIESDDTDGVTYVADEWDCVDYAERLHNNAEAAGIKAAFVAIHFRGETVGHAANAFNTTDRGLVYIDCTGQEYLDQLLKKMPTFSGPQFKVIEYGLIKTADKAAYAEIGKPYGLIGIEVDYGATYAGYDDWRRDMALFQSKLDAYEAKRAGRQFVSPEEYQALKQQQKEIDELGKKLGGFWEPLGIVDEIEVYW